mmetsp:Transcript_1283/g.3034  ORF Transcript_1283/g.3034 Transcript_1283/m.3034 type:complete len:310 (+) Transcript_1283:199-1128(+)
MLRYHVAGRSCGGMYEGWRLGCGCGEGAIARSPGDGCLHRDDPPLVQQHQRAVLRPGKHQIGHPSPHHHPPQEPPRRGDHMHAIAAPDVEVAQHVGLEPVRGGPGAPGGVKLREIAQRRRPPVGEVGHVHPIDVAGHFEAGHVQCRAVGGEEDPVWRQAEAARGQSVGHLPRPHVQMVHRRRARVSQCFQVDVSEPLAVQGVGEPRVPPVWREGDVVGGVEGAASGGGDAGAWVGGREVGEVAGLVGTRSWHFQQLDSPADTAAPHATQQHPAVPGSGSAAGVEDVGCKGDRAADFPSGKGYRVGEGGD